MESYTTVLFTIIFVAISYWIIQRKRRLSLFQRYGIPGPKPNFWTGNLNEFIEKRESCTPEWTKKYGKFVGFYFGAKPWLIAYDVEFLKTIQVKEFQKFANKDMILPDAGLPHKSMLRFVEMLKDEEWKTVRSSLTGAFTTGKIKMIFPIISHTVSIFMDNIKLQCQQPFDILDFFKKLTFDTTSKASFGVATDVQNNEKSKFVDSVYSALTVDSTNILATLSVCFPEFEPIPTKLRTLVDVCKYFLNQTSILYLAKTCEKIIESRKVVKDPPVDLLQVMINANVQTNSSSNEEITNDDSISRGNARKMSDEEVLGNAIGMMVAGYHTGSITMAYCAYCLSKHPDVQEKVRKEINKHFKPEEEIEYTGLANLQYLDQVISETLRLYPLALSVINRICKEDFKYKGITIPKGTLVVVPVWTLHKDPDYWSDPQSFIPERFSPENRGNIDQYIYQPFGAGPRICIGMRLANAIMKYTFANLIRKYRLESCDDGKELELEYSLFFVTPKNGIRVKAVPV